MNHPSDARDDELETSNRVHRIRAGVLRPLDRGGRQSHREWSPAEPDAPGSEPNSTLELDIRPARITDLARLIRTSDIHVFNQPESSIDRFSLARSAIRAAVPSGRGRTRMFTATVEDRLVGFIQFQPAYQDRRWHAIALGSATGVYDAAPVEHELIRHAVTAAGLRGVKRLYARVASGSDQVSSFSRLGFAPFATETIFLGTPRPVSVATSSLRVQERSDTWAIHQLYNAIIPKQVQYAEALTSHRWDLNGTNELARGMTRRGWLIESGHNVIAYARVSSRGGTHLLELLYLPDHTDQLRGLLDTVIARLHALGRVDRMYCTLRGYQAEAATALDERGFSPVLEQDLLVKYTTARTRSPQPEPLALHAEVIERLPKRVPSFVHQTSRNDSA